MDSASVTQRRSNTRKRDLNTIEAACPPPAKRTKFERPTLSSQRSSRVNTSSSDVSNNNNSSSSDDPDPEQSPDPESEGNNSEEAYKHHPGSLDVDWDGDFWADHDEDCHGRIDTNAMRREYPDGFRWSCCDKLGNESGCESRSTSPTPLEERYAKSPEPSLDEEECYHPGSLDVDWYGGFWADHDEDCHGPIDTKSNRREYPDGFIWSCCGATGTFSEGCSRT